MLVLLFAATLHLNHRWVQLTAACERLLSGDQSLPDTSRFWPEADSGGRLLAVFDPHPGWLVVVGVAGRYSLIVDRRGSCDLLVERVLSRLRVEKTYGGYQRIIWDVSGAVPIPQLRPWGIVWGIFDFAEITP
jgi:hypothetical protein